MSQEEGGGGKEEEEPHHPSYLVLRAEFFITVSSPPLWGFFGLVLLLPSPPFPQPTTC
jgi:hypothetical protein